MQVFCATDQRLQRAVSHSLIMLLSGGQKKVQAASVRLRHQAHVNALRSHHPPAYLFLIFPSESKNSFARTLPARTSTSLPLLPPPLPPPPPPSPQPPGNRPHRLMLPSVRAATLLLMIPQPLRFTPNASAGVPARQTALNSTNSDRARLLKCAEIT